MSWVLPALVGLLALAPVLLALPLQTADQGLFIDWWVYALGSLRVLAGESLYLPQQLAGPYQLPAVTPQGYIYPPPSAVLFLPFATHGVGVIAWVALNVLTFLAGIVAVLKRELGGVGPISLGVALAGLLIVIPLPDGELVAPFSSGVGTANVNVALAGVLALCWATGSARRWIPYAAGLLGVFKLFPAALVVWAARTRGWRAIAIAACAAAIITVVTLPLTGLDEWQHFSVALSNADPTCDGGRTSIACLTEPLVGSRYAKLIGVAVGVLLVVLAVVVRSDYPAFVLLTFGMLAPLADGHAHYLLFIYVLAVIGGARLYARGRRHPASIEV